MRHHTIQTSYCHNCKRFSKFCVICLFDNNGQPKECNVEEPRRHNATQIVDKCQKCENN